VPRHEADPPPVPPPRPASHQADAAAAAKAAPARPDPTDTRSWSVGGCLAYAAFVVAAACYFYVRASELARSPAPVTPYAAFILAVEALGASSVFLYGLCIVRRLPGCDLGAAGPVPAGTHVHTLVPCYTEDLAIVSETVWAAAEADVPPGVRSTVYLCDDGNDAAKEAWVAGLKSDRIRYVAGRPRGAAEANGKACNLNHALGLIFAGKTPPATDAVAVFDADQVADKAFYTKTLPSLAASADTALVLTPQKFANVDDAADIFNHSNRHFWEAMIPGLTAWGMVVCTGTNLVLRADALMAVGGFPTSTVTEDYLLGMNLKMAGHRARYIPEYLAVGEAPEDGSVFRQRSRWCKGHLQALFSRDCPAFQSKLSLVQKLLYSSGAWAYAAAAVTTPALAAVPVAALVADVVPFAITPRLACAFVPYFVAVHGVVYWCGAPDLLRALWFGGVATRLLWWTYAKALANTALWALGLKTRMAFKTTAKAGVAPSAGGAARRAPSQRAMAAPAPPPSSSRIASFRDLWAPMALLAASAGAAGHGWRRIAAGEDSASLDVAIAWALYNALPPLLLAHYAWLGRGASLRGACGAAMLLCAGVLASAAAVGYLFLPPHIRGDAFGAARGGSYASLLLPTGPRVAYYGDAILGAKAGAAARNATAALRTTLG